MAALPGQIFLLRAGKGWRKEARCPEAVLQMEGRCLGESRAKRTAGKAARGSLASCILGLQQHFMQLEVEARGKTGRKSQCSLLGKQRSRGHVCITC